MKWFKEESLFIYFCLPWGQVEALIRHVDWSRDEVKWKDLSIFFFFFSAWLRVLQSGDLKGKSSGCKNFKSAHTHTHTCSLRLSFRSRQGSPHLVRSTNTRAYALFKLLLSHTHTQFYKLTLFDINKQRKMSNWWRNDNLCARWCWPNLHIRGNK